MTLGKLLADVIESAELPAGRQVDEYPSNPEGYGFVLDCCCQPKTNGLGLGRTQRAVLAYLATAPYGFGDPVFGHGPRDFSQHGVPLGTPVRAIARHVYSTDEPSAAQVRVVQRAVRRLEVLGLAWSYHAWSGRSRPYTTRNGWMAEQPVSQLYTALHWECRHLSARDRRSCRCRRCLGAEADA